MTDTSQHNDLPLCHGTSVRPSGLFPSVRNNPDGSFVTGVPAEAKLRATRSLRAWCLAVLPGAFLQKKNCEARKRRLVNLNGIDVECRDLDPASNRLQLSLPRHLISMRMMRWAAQTANLHCVGKRLPRMMLDGKRGKSKNPCSNPKLCLENHQIWLTNPPNGTAESCC